MGPYSEYGTELVDIGVQIRGPKLLDYTPCTVVVYCSSKFQSLERSLFLRLVIAKQFLV